MRRFSVIQENPERQLNELRSKVKWTEGGFFCLFFHQIKKILEVNNSMNEIKNALESLGNRGDQIKERISNLDNRNLEMTQEREIF